MSLLGAHKGYEYQDLFTAYHIIQMLLTDKEATFMIDQKESKNDKFDDFIIISETSILKKQVKYSENKKLEKADLSSERYDLALDTLYKSWQELPKGKQIDIRICLAWEFVEASQELNFLIESKTVNHYHDDNVKILKINLEAIWPLGKPPISSWRRLGNQSVKINRREFEKFISDLSIEVNLPKSSGDFQKPNDLENLVIQGLRDFGIGKYPNDKKSVEDVGMHLLYIIKKLRSRGETIKSSELIYKLGLMKSYGNIEQNFKIDRKINILNETKNQNFKDFLFKNDKVTLLGEPGAGKSWFIQNFKEYLENQHIKVIQHYCYTKVNDYYEKERITIDIFLANLTNDIIKNFPHLKSNKLSKFGVDFEELQILVNHIKDEVVLIVDGLDHIGRIYSFHKERIKQIDTQIIDVISRLEFPSNIKVILGSQPITEIINLSGSGFKEYSIEPWKVLEVKEFMNNNGLEDIEVSRGTMLSQLLIEKSSGNPLYLTYLVNELTSKKNRMITRETIESFPSYNINLENYYHYLMTELSENQKVPQILAGAPFSLTEVELKDITGLGNLVSKSIEIFRSILSYSSASGGYVIYHESFRRYILELLEKNEVSLEKAIYSDLIDWLINKGFYEDRKSYINLFTLLFESKRYDDILEYCNKEFVFDSVFYGNNIESIKNNFTILMKSSSLLKNFHAVIICTEISNMIYSLEYSFEDNSENYYLGLGYFKGFEILKHMLTYDGGMALDLNEGLKICYLCSENNVIPDWKDYINLLVELRNSENGRRKSEENFLEDYKYYICACLDLGVDIQVHIEKASGKDHVGIREVIIKEYLRRDSVDELNEQVSKIKENKYWIESINVFLGISIVDEQYLEEALEELSNTKEHSPEALKALNFYTSNIQWIIKNHPNKVKDFTKSIENKNWYYNWLIYVSEINKVLVESEGNQIFDDYVLIEKYKWLIKDTDVFKGKPRTCDLYKFESIIFNSIISPLKFISKESTWRNVLLTISEMSSKTITTLDGATGGPMATIRFLDLLLEIANETNSKIVTELFEQKIEKEDKYRYYAYLADYNLKFSTLLSKGGEFNRAKEEFRKGIKFLLSYSFRKDRTLSRLIDSVESIYKVDSALGIKSVLKLKPLADAVVTHTDGRDTSNYPVEWFEVLVKMDKDIAITYLSYELLNVENYWVLEKSFDMLLEIMNSSDDPVIENALFKTRSNLTMTSTINSYLNNIKTLIDISELKLARISMRELLNRFPDGVYEDDYEGIEEICDILNVSYNSLTKEEIKTVATYKKGKKESDSNNKHIGNFDFNEMSYDEIIEYIVDFGLTESHFSGLISYMQAINDINDDSKLFISKLITHLYDYRCKDESREVILRVINKLSLNNEVMAYLYMNIFLEHKGGWGEKFTQIEFFKKATNYSWEIAEDCFFNFFYNSFNTITYDLAVGDKIINALSAIGYEGELLIKYWESLFEIVDFRLSGQYDFDSEELIRQNRSSTSEEKAMFLLITRLKYGEANRYKWILSSLDKMLEKQSYRKIFVNVFKVYIENNDKFIDYATIILLWIIRKKFNKEALEDNNLINEIIKLSPSNNSIINYLIKDITGKKIDRSYQDYKQSYDGNDEEVNYFKELLLDTDRRMNILDSRGIDAGNITKNYLEEITSDFAQNDVKNSIFDREYNVFAPNVYFYNMLTKCIAKEMKLFLNSVVEFPFFSMLEEEIYEILLDDIDYIISNCNSLITRPSYIVKPEKIQNSIEEVELQKWITLGYYERWYDKREKHNRESLTSKSTLIVSAIGFTDNCDIPLLRLSDGYRIYDENEMDEKKVADTHNPLLIATNLQLEEDILLSYVPNDYLIIRADILRTLEIKMTDEGEGIVGKDSSGKNVVTYSKWEVCFDDIDTDSYRIPYLIGAELKMKKDKYEEMCQLFGRNANRITRKLRV